MSKSMSNSKERKAVVLYHADGDYWGAIAPLMEKSKALKLINDALSVEACKQVTTAEIEYVNVVTGDNLSPFSPSTEEVKIFSVKIIPDSDYHSCVNELPFTYKGKILYPVCFVSGEVLENE